MKNSELALFERTIRNLYDPNCDDPRTVRTMLVNELERLFELATADITAKNLPQVHPLIEALSRHREVLGREGSALLIRCGLSLLGRGHKHADLNASIVTLLTKTLVSVQINDLYWDTYSFANKGDSASAVDYCRQAITLIGTSTPAGSALLEAFCLGMGKKLIRDWNTFAALLDFAAAFPEKTDSLIHGVFLNLLLLKRSLNSRLGNDKSDLAHTSISLHRSLVRLLDSRKPDESIYLLLVTIIRLLPQINDEDRIGSIRALSERFDEDRDNPADPWRNRANALRKEIHQKPSERNIELVAAYLSEQDAIARGEKAGPADTPEMVETAREIHRELRIFWKTVSETNQIHREFEKLVENYPARFSEKMREELALFEQAMHAGSTLKANDHLTRFRKNLRGLVESDTMGKFRFDALSFEVSAERSSFACQSSLCDFWYQSWNIGGISAQIELLCQIVRSVRAFGGGSKELGRTGILLEQEMQDSASGVDTVRKLIKDILNLTKQQTDIMKNRYTDVLGAMLRELTSDLSNLENDRYQIGIYNYFFRSTSFLHLGEFAAFLSANLLPFLDTRLSGSTPLEDGALFWRFHGTEKTSLPPLGALRYTVGGKAASLLTMHALGLPVPGGFSIATWAGTESFDEKGLKQEFRHALLQELKALEASTGLELGNQEKPLLISVRSGAPVSMPGMMDTILNIGLNDDIVASCIAREGNPSFWYDCYIHLIVMYAKSTQPAASSQELDGFMRSWYQHKSDATSVRQLENILGHLKARYASMCGHDFPHDVNYQLESAIIAVFESWDSERARNYRAIHHIPAHLGTGVTVQRMVFGNRDHYSCSGVYFTRHPETGNPAYGDLVRQGQGEAVVSGQTSSQRVQEMEVFAPEAWKQLQDWGTFLEQKNGQPQDMEFVVESGTLFMLQTRKARLTTRGLLFSLIDMVTTGMISKRDALRELNTETLEDLDHLSFSRKSIENAETGGRVLCHGLGVFHGVAVGRAVFSLSGLQKMEAAFPGEACILVKEDTKPEDIEAMYRSAGCATRVGGPTSHAAINARVIGRPCVVNCTTMTIVKDDYDSILEIRVGDRLIHEGDVLSLDGSRALLISGTLPIQERSLDQETRTARDTFLNWAQEMHEGAIEVSE